MAKKKAAKKSAGASNALVIVESPAKAKTIGKYLGKGYTVEASVGHVRDLPQGAKQVPAKYKGESWANLGVNVEDNFTPIYVTTPGKSKQIKLLKDQLKKADVLYLATDEDREGEAISWHLFDLAIFSFIAAGGLASLGRRPAAGKSPRGARLALT